MSRDPRFSVIMPAFNAAGTIASAIQSVLCQTEVDREIIVVDDGSTDATSDIVAGIADPRVHLVSQPNQGPAAARNHGIAVARGRYVSFLDSDDLWLPDYLTLSGRAVDSGESIGFAYTDAYAFDAHTGRVRRGSAMHGGSPPDPPPADPREFLSELIKRNFIYISTTVPRSVLADVGDFNEALAGAEDYDMWLRILTRGYRAVHVPGRHALYRLHSGQASRDAAALKRGELLLFAGISPTDMPTDALRDLLAQRRLKAERELALALARGAPPLTSSLRRLRYWLGATRQRLGLGKYAWCDSIPSEIAVAYPDLTRI